MQRLELMAAETLAFVRLDSFAEGKAPDATVAAALLEVGVGREAGTE